MSRYIDADALHDALKAKQKWVVRCGDKHNEGYTYDQVHFAIDEAPTIDAVSEWVPCEERLPSKDGKYLIVGRQGAVNILPYHDGMWYGRWGVIAWMPLPKPYREREGK